MARRLAVSKRTPCGTEGEDYVMQLLSCPEAQCLAGVCSDAVVRLYDERSLFFARELRGHTARVNDVAVCGSVLATASEDATVALWDVRTGKAQAQLAEPGGAEVLSVAVSADGAVLVMGSGEGSNTVHAWDLRTMTLQRSLDELHTAEVTRLKFHPSQPWALFSGSNDGVLAATDLREADPDEAAFDFLAPGSSVDNFGFFGDAHDMVWCQCADHGFSLFQLSPPATDDDSPPSQRILHFPDLRSAMTQLLAPAGGVGGKGAAAEVKYAVGCVFDASDQTLKTMVGDYDGAMSLVSISPAGAQCHAHLTGGHRDQVRGWVVAADGQSITTCGEDAAMCSWSLADPEAASSPLPSSDSEGEGSGAQKTKRYSPF